MNLEADLLAKYTEQLLLARGALPTPAASSLDAGWLAEHGWG